MSIDRTLACRSSIALMLLSSASTVTAQSGPASPDPLATEFKDPPAAARPRVWWHWMNGNITKEGIAADIAWMKRSGIGGLQNFETNLATPKVVDNRLVYMTPPWKDAFRFAAERAEAVGLEFGIASSPGFSETGGPWVAPKDGLKKLVWSETAITGGARFAGTLPAPPTTTGPYQSVPIGKDVMGAAIANPPAFYADVAVLAWRMPAATPARYTASVAGTTVDAAAFADDDLQTTLLVAPVAGQANAVTLDHGKPQSFRSATAFMPGSEGGLFGGGITANLEASDDSATWRAVAPIPAAAVPTTVAFAPVTARYFRLSFPAGKRVKLAQFRLSDAPRIDRAETKAAFALTPDYYALPTSAPATDRGIAPADVIDLTSHLRPDGTLDWTPPRGTWRVLRLGYSLTGKTNHPAPPEATGLEVDKFDAAAVRAYLDTYLGMYRDAAGPDLLGKKGVRALLSDSTEVGAANWTPCMVEQFGTLRGYDPTPYLPALTGTLVGTRAQSDAFLYDFRRTLADLMASEHYATVAKVAHDAGLTVYGEALEDNRPVIGDDMAMRSFADVPMAANWVFPRDGKMKPTYLADMKGAASVGHLYGRPIIAAESLTALSPAWSDTPATLRRIIDLEFASGINRAVIHTSVHQPLDKAPGVSMYIIGQFFNRHETWAEMARPWMDYMARSSLLLQQGVNVADVAYFYGEEAPITGLYGQTPVTDAPTRYAYDFVNADVLNTILSVDNGDLVAKSGARYKLLYLGGSSRRMTLPTLRRIAALADQGATIVGTAPAGSPSLGDDPAEYRTLVDKLWGSPRTTGRVIAGQDVEGALARISVTPAFSYAKRQPDSDIPFVQRRTDTGDIFFLVNRRNRPERIEARFRTTGKAPELWHADTGKSEPVSYRTEGAETIVPLDLDAEESVFVLFRRPAAVPALTIAKPVLAPAIPLAGPWKVAFQPGRGAPAAITLPALAPLNEQADAGVKYFSGVATYTSNFALPRAPRAGAPLMLDLGQVGDLAEVRVNGMLVATAWHAPYRVDIGRAAKRGRNRLEIRVANAWVNRLIGDQQPGATKIGFITIKPYSATSPLRPAGLIGPVTLETPQ